MKTFKEILLLQIAVLVTGYAKAQSTNCIASNNGIVEHIESVYPELQLSRYNVFRWQDSLWGNQKPGQPLSLTKEQRLLALGVAFNGNQEATTTMHLPNLQVLYYNNIILDSSIGYKILLMLRKNPTVKQVVINDTLGEAIDLLEINWPFASNIEALRINKRFRALGPSIIKLQKLRFLSIRSQDFENLPEAIGSLTQLEDLEIVGNAADCIKQLDHLLALEGDIQGLGKINRLPNSFKKLTALRRLVIHSEALKDFPTELSNCPNLTQLELYTPNLDKSAPLHLWSGKVHLFEALRQLILINSAGFAKSIQSKGSGIFAPLSKEGISLFVLKSPMAAVLEVDSLFHRKQYNKIIIIPDKASLGEEYSPRPSPAEIDRFSSYHYYTQIEILKYGKGITDIHDAYKKVVYKMYGKTVVHIAGLYYKGTYIEGCPPFESSISPLGFGNRLINMDKASCDSIAALQANLTSQDRHSRGCILGSWGLEQKIAPSTLHSLYLDGKCVGDITAKLSLLNKSEQTVNLRTITLYDTPDSCIYKLPPLPYLNHAIFTTYATKGYAKKEVTRFDGVELPQLNSIEWNIHTGSENEFYLDRTFFHSPIRSFTLRYIKTKPIPIKTTVNIRRIEGAQNYLFYDDIPDRKITITGLSSNDDLDLELSWSSMDHLCLDVHATFLARLQEKFIQRLNFPPLHFARELVLDSCEHISDWDIPIPLDTLQKKMMAVTGNTHVLKKLTLFRTLTAPSCLSKIITLETLICKGVKNVDLSVPFSKDAHLRTIILEESCTQISLQGIKSLPNDVDIYILNEASLDAFKQAVKNDKFPINLFIPLQVLKHHPVAVATITANINSLHITDALSNAAALSTVIHALSSESTCRNCCNIYIE